MTLAQPIKAAGADRGRRPHLPALDGLRGVAILGVLLFHTGHLPGGFLGVDLFFALSGYLITDLLLREVDASGTVSPAAFWGRRVRRLLPALAAMLAGVTVLVRAVGAPGMVRTTLADGPWVLLNLVNWHLLAESAGYWDRFGPGRVFGHLWSIAVEEQFYLVWPVVLLIIARFVRRVDRWVAVVAVLGSVVSLVLMVTLVSPADPTRVYTGTDTRAFSLLLGGAVATRPGRAVLVRVVGRWAGAVLVLLVVGIGAVWTLADGVGSLWLFSGGLFAHSLAAALLIGLCVRAPDARVAKVLARRPLRWLGLISYSLYLWHWPVIVLLSPERTGLGEWPLTVVVIAVSIGLAVLSKYLVEDPIRFRAEWARGRSGLLALRALVVGLTVLRSMITSGVVVTTTRFVAIGAISVRRFDPPGPASSNAMASEIVPRWPVSRGRGRSSPFASTKYSVTPGATPVGARPAPLTPEGWIPQPASSSRTTAGQIRLTRPPGSVAAAARNAHRPRCSR